MQGTELRDSCFRPFATARYLLSAGSAMAMIDACATWLFSCGDGCDSEGHGDVGIHPALRVLAAGAVVAADRSGGDGGSGAWATAGAPGGQASGWA